MVFHISIVWGHVRVGRHDVMHRTLDAFRWYSESPEEHIQWKLHEEAASMRIVDEGREDIQVAAD